MMIVNIPIEPLEERYSAQWCKWFEDELTARAYNYFSITPIKPLAKIKEGAFLDIIGTTRYKAQQIDLIAQMTNIAGGIERDRRVVFLIHDGWFPVEQLAYMRDMLGCHDWRFVGIFHDGTYDKWDMTARNNMYTWGEDIENGWFKIYDKVIVASNYHKQTLLETRCIPDHKIEVIPWKVEVPDSIVKKENIIVFPHRLNEDKQQDLFFKMADELKHPDWQWIRTRDENLNKQQYYELLAKAKIVFSTALLEMFGIAMVEAVLLGCIPLVPDRLAYKEMYPSCFNYSDVKDMKDKLALMMHEEDYHHAEWFNLMQRFKRNSRSFFPDLFAVMENL